MPARKSSNPRKDPNQRRIVDIHSHILPALDDGSTSMEETIEMLRIAFENGTTDMIVTPHFRKGRKNASPDAILSVLNKVQQEAKRQQIDITLYPGNEIYYYQNVEEAIETKELCTLNNSEHILVEFSPTESFIYIRNALDGLNGMGYIPILAHVERYECMLNEMENVEHLRALNVEIQLNASSIVGEQGHKVKTYAHHLLKNRLVDYIATDAHDSRKRTPAIKKCYKILEKKYDSAYIDKVTYLNAAKILGR